MARKLYIVRFTVRGTGEFPFDMLRYDACHPRNEGEARRLGNTYANGKAPTEPVSVELESRGRPSNWWPTAARWQSFGWTVSQTDIESHEHS